MFAAVEVGVFKFVIETVQALIGAHAARKRNLFEHHIEPLQDRMTAIHRDYVVGFQKIRKHLADKTVASSDIIEFLKERRRVYAHEREQAQDLAREMDKARKAGINDDLWRAVDAYVSAILRYFSMRTQHSWFLGFLHSLETSVLAEQGKGEFWSGLSNNGKSPRDALVCNVDFILDVELPRAFGEVSRSYATLRARLL